MGKTAVFSRFLYLLIGSFFIVPSALAMGTSEPLLYDRLGGVYNIATVVDDFVERLYVNGTLNANPKIKEAFDGVAKAGLKYQITSFVCQGAGGPQKYVGRTMKGAHQNLNINEKEWAAMAEDFKRTLDKFMVPEKEQKELFGLVSSARGDIIRQPEEPAVKPLFIPPLPGGAPGVPREAY